jgi:outer membrane protein assembly factor BamA
MGNLLEIIIPWMHISCFSGRQYAHFLIGPSVVIGSSGDPAGARGKPGSGYGYGVGVRVDSPLGPLRLEYAFNDRQARRFHFGVGYRN